MQDIITREITVKAPKERVYKAITNPTQITTWFPDAIEGNLESGSRAMLDFGTDGKTQIYIEAANPFEYFAYRWVPGNGGKPGDVLDQPNTLVEFYIEELAEGTKITLKESGFAALPVEVAESSFKDNSGGWEYMMDRLEKTLTQA